MSPLRGIIALAVVLVAAAVIYQMRGETETPQALTALDDGPAAPTDSAMDNTAPDPSSPIPSEALSGTTRTEAQQESLAPATDAIAAPAYAITGSVLDEQGRPVSGADVQLVRHFGDDMILLERSEAIMSNAQATKTASDGRFQFEAVDATDSFTVRAVPDALMSAELKLTQRRTGDLDVGVLTAALGAELIGHVVSDAGQPVPEAEVRAWTKQGNSGSSPGRIVFGDVGARNARSAVTDDAGYFRIRGLEPGNVTALAKAEGFTQESVRDIVIKKGARSADVTIKVSEGSAISGVVVDESGQPLANAEVGVMETVINLDEGGVVGELGQNLSTRSREDGTFRLSGLKSSNYNLSVSKAGFLNDMLRDVEAGTDDVRLTLGKSAVLFGYVRNRVTGQPIQAFDVHLQSEHMGGLPGGLFLPGNSVPVARGPEAATLAGVADAPGLYAVSGLPSKGVSLVVEADGFAEYRFGPVRVDTRGSVQQDAELMPEITLSGRVVDATGQPVPGASVNLTERSDEEAMFLGGGRIERRMEISNSGGKPRVIDGDSRFNDISDASGRFTLKGIAPGEYQLLASHNEWAPSEQLAMDLGEGDQLEHLVVALRAGGAVTGQTFDADGHVLGQATVALNQAPSAQQGPGGGARSMSMSFGGGLPGQGLKQTESDGQGVFRLGGILPGRYLLELKNPNSTGGGAMMFMLVNSGADSKGTPVTIEAGETATVDLYLPPTGTVTGSVTEAGNPLAGVSVSLKDQRSPFPMGGPSARTDDNGRFQMSNVEPGDYTLTVSPSGAAQPIERDLEVRARETANSDIKLPTGIVAGRVTNSGDGQPISGVIVKVDPAGAKGEESKSREPPRRMAMVIMSTEDSGSGGITTMRLGSEPDSVMTDENGYYEVRYVAPGDYTVAVSGSGIEKMKQDRVRVFEGQRSDGIDFKAVLGATLVVRPTTDSSDALHFFRAKLINQATGEEQEQSEVGQPTMRIEGLAAGNYLVEINANNMSGEKQVQIGSGEEKEIQVPIK